MRGARGARGAVLVPSRPVARRDVSCRVSAPLPFLDKEACRTAAGCRRGEKARWTRDALRGDRGDTRGQQVPRTAKVV